MPLSAAETALLEERRPITRREALDVAHLSLDSLPELISLAHRVRMEWRGPEVELEGLLNTKSGACAEDCSFCSQSAHFPASSIEAYPFLELDRILAAAEQTRDAGATQFCLVVAVRGPDQAMIDKVVEATKAVMEKTGLEVACSLGLLQPGQADQLAAAGVKRYNHNLESPRSRFDQVCTTHSYDDRVETCNRAKASGMELCSGGILGMGESLEERVEFAFELRELDPCEVPINFLDPRPGTPLGDAMRLPAREALQSIALFRLVLPKSWLRLAGGREKILGELQSMGMYAGANALVVGDYLTTEGRSAQQDHLMLDSLGMPVAEGPSEGRFVVDSRGSHSLPAKASGA